MPVLKEKLHIKGMPAGTLCEIHTWPTEGLPQRLQQAMRARHGMGGINVCSTCVERARKEAHAHAK